MKTGECWGLSRPEDRYMNDPVFHALVDTMLAHLQQDEMRTYTPSDLRQAANFAAFLYESRTIRTLRNPPDPEAR